MGSVAQTLVAQGAPPTVMGEGVAASNGSGPLVDVARRVVDALASDLAGTGIGVVLSDAGGHVVDRRVSEPRLGVHHLPEATGPATPIIDPRSGRTVGQLELVSDRSDANPLVRSLAALAVREIQQRLVDDEAVAERLALGRFLKNRRGAKGPFVLVTERRFIPNAAADRLVGPDDGPMLRVAASRLCDRLEDVTTIELKGRVVAVRAVPVPDDEPPGIILQLKPLDADTGRAGHRPERGSCGWASLTDTERSVAHVVAEGLTNREAAERLFLSPHTVDFHLRSIFRKLGTNTRVHLTRLVILAQRAQGDR